MYTRGAVGRWQGPIRLQQHPLSPWGTRYRPLRAECRAGA